MRHDERTTRGLPAVLIAALLVAASPLARATHQVDHRYTVSGTIAYEDGTPAEHVPVHFTVANGHPIGTVKSDKQGRYKAILHVHNDDLRKVFDMHVAGQDRKVRILFDPGDTKTDRGQRIDFTVTREAAAAAIESAAQAEAEEEAARKAREDAASPDGSG